jgi:Zn-dependent peptidase ImmA (M78 family)
MTKLRPGFTREAETIAEDMRAELGIKNINRLEPLHLAAHLDIVVLSLTTLAGLGLAVPSLGRAIDTLRGDEQSALSAVTVFDGSKRLVVYNNEHSVARQASDITHELAHGLLLHQPAPALDERGCRAWNTDVENEASYLGGALLIPGKAARWVVKCGITPESAAEKFGCSIEMVRWRLSASGARRLAKVQMSGGSSSIR